MQRDAGVGSEPKVADWALQTPVGSHARFRAIWARQVQLMQRRFAWIAAIDALERLALAGDRTCWAHIKNPAEAGCVFRDYRLRQGLLPVGKGHAA